MMKGVVVQCTTSAECCTDDSFWTPLMEAVGRGKIKNSNLRAVTSDLLSRSYVGSRFRGETKGCDLLHGPQHLQDQGNFYFVN
jgi:hypothetical protein